MAKNIPDAQMDVALNDIKNNADIVHGCSAQPADYAGIAAVSLGSAAVDSADFTVGDGDVSGRKITLGSQSITWSGSGNCNHIVVADSGESLIKAITTIPEMAVVEDETTAIQAVDLWEIRDPA